jgi:phosphatidylinositol glycan class N
VASFFERRLLAPAILLGAVYQLRQSQDHSFIAKATYSVLSILLSLFTFQVSVGRSRSELQVLLAGVSTVILTQVLLRITRSRLPRNTNVILSAYLCLSGLCVLLSSSQWVSEVTWLLRAVQTTSWTILLTGIPVALLGTKPILLQRMLALFMALQSAYMLLALSYEGLLLLVLGALLCAWVHMEFTDRNQHRNLTELQLNMAPQRPRNVVSSKDAFHSLFFLLFSVASFFGTGNIASLNSFDPRSIRCLVAVFSPFVMGGLLLLKVLIPFLAVAIFTRLVLHISRLHTRALVLLLLLFSDIMALHFFFLVTDEGSWQEIGTSLSHFVIAQATVIFLQVFIALAGFLLTFSRHSGQENLGEDVDIYVH